MESDDVFEKNGKDIAPDRTANNPKNTKLDNIIEEEFGETDSNDYTLRIIGEIHADIYNLRKEIEIIKEIKPGYLLMETLSDLAPTPLSYTKNYMPLISKSLSDILLEKKDGDKIKDLVTESLKRAYNSSIQEINKSNYAEDMSSFEDFVNATIYKVSSNTLDLIINDIRAEYQHEKEAAEKDFATGHDLINDDTLSNNHYNNYEVLGTKAADLVKLKENLVRITYKETISGQNSILALFEAAYKANPNVILGGIDISSDEKMEIMRKGNVEKYNERREKIMGATSSIYALDAVRDGNKIVAIVGKAHSRRDSGIYEYLEDAGVKYRVSNLNRIAEDSRYCDYISSFKEESEY